MMVFTVHQLYKYTCLPELNGLFPIRVNEIASTVDDQNNFHSKRRRATTCIKEKNNLNIRTMVQGCAYGWSICI